MGFISDSYNAAQSKMAKIQADAKQMAEQVADEVVPDGAKGTMKAVGVNTGLIDKEKATITVDPESNTATADIDYSKVPEEHRSRVMLQVDGVATQLHHKQLALDEARANDAPRKEIMALQAEVDSLQAKLTDVKYHIETVVLSGIEIAAYLTNFGLVVDEMIESKADIEDIDESLGAKTYKSDKAPGPSGRSSSGGPSGAGGEYSAEEMVRIMREDPDKFKELMSGEDKDAKMMMMQDYMQSQNRFWSMMTSLQNAEHQTTKAILSNLRV